MVLLLRYASTLKPFPSPLQCALMTVFPFACAHLHARTIFDGFVLLVFISVLNLCSFVARIPHWQKCTAADLEYYVRECGEILGVTGELSDVSPDSTGPMGILNHVFKRLIRFKMLNQVFC